MSPKDSLIALLVVTVWGVNFYVTKTALDGFPPLLLGALRFGLVAVPALFFIPKPQTSWLNIAVYGTLISFGQFAFLFTAIHLGMPTGLASLILQSHVFFSVLLGILFFKDIPSKFNIIGIGIAAIGLVSLASTGGHGLNFSVLAFTLTLCGGLSWAGGNMMIKRIGSAVNPMSLVVWGSIIPSLLFLVCSLIVEHPNLALFKNAPMSSYVALGYLSFAASIVGYMLWGRLLNTYTVGKIAPLTLVVPVLGLSIGAVFLGEHLNTSQWLSVLIILLGLMVNLLGQRVLTSLRLRMTT